MVRFERNPIWIVGNFALGKVNEIKSEMRTENMWENKRLRNSVTEVQSIVSVSISDEKLSFLNQN